MPAQPDPTTSPCPNCQHTGGVARIEWGDTRHVIYYRCAGCGHLWVTDRRGNPIDRSEPAQ